jgi:hypothetical protein
MRTENAVGADADHPERDAAWDRHARNESPTERLDRNWADLLQELRVTQTGVQLLTGFLLTLPFQQRFTQLSAAQHGVYLATVALSAAATVLLIAPVSLHRGLFRRHARRELVSAAHRCAMAGLGLLGLAVTGVTLLIFDVVSGPAAGVIAGACTFVGVATLWGLLPWVQRSRADDQDSPAGSGRPGRR